MDTEFLDSNFNSKIDKTETYSVKALKATELYMINERTVCKSYLKKLLHTCTKTSSSWAPVAHACNPSYLEGRNQEDRGLKSDQANRS
jgi:hypothetical protein